MSSSAAPERPIPDWDWLLRSMQGTSRGPAARDAGLWALETTRTFFGEDWTTRAYSKRALPGFLLYCSSHAVALLETLEWAARTIALGSTPGIASVRRPVQRDIAGHRLAHAALQLEVAALSKDTLGPPRLEATIDGGAPVDVVVPGPYGTIPIETFVLMADQQMRAGFAADDELSETMLRIRLEHDVEFDGQLWSALTPPEIDRWLERLDLAAREVAASGDPIDLKDAHSNLRVLPGALANNASFSGPTRSGRGWSRTDQRLRGKAEQAQVSGARWLRLDMRDGTWQFSNWSALPFAQRVDHIALAVCQATQDLGLDGVVVSSGACQLQGSYVEQSRPAAGHLGLARQLDVFRARETVIVPMSKRGRLEAPIWHQIYEAEPAWLGAALKQNGLPTLSEIFST